MITIINIYIFTVAFNFIITTIFLNSKKFKKSIIELNENDSIEVNKELEYYIPKVFFVLSFFPVFNFLYALIYMREMISRSTKNTVKMIARINVQINKTLSR